MELDPSWIVTTATTDTFVLATWVWPTPRSACTMAATPSPYARWTTTAPPTLRGARRRSRSRTTPPNWSGAAPSGVPTAASRGGVRLAPHGPGWRADRAVVSLLVDPGRERRRRHLLHQRYPGGLAPGGVRPSRGPADRELDAARPGHRREPHRARGRSPTPGRSIFGRRLSPRRQCGSKVPGSRPKTPSSGR